MDLFAFKSLLFLLSFIGCCAGQDEVLPPGPVEAKLGTNVTIKTLLKKENFDIILWNFNNGADQVNVATLRSTGLSVSELYQGRASINETNGYLYLGPLKSTDSGDYSITVVPKAGASVTGDIKLEVLEPVSDVVITSKLSEAVEQETVVLTCTAKGSFLKFKWINGTTPVVVDGLRVSLEEKELSSELTIAGVYRSDLVGPIYCTAANNLETEKSAPFNLTVHYGPDNVAISPPNPAPAFKSGSDFNLSCSAISSPDATFIWYHNNQMMEASGPVLTLALIEKHNFGSLAGNYTCRATNAKTGRTISSPPVSFAIIKGISGVKITGPTGVLIAGNSTANISCQATDGVVKTALWLKDHKPLSPSARVVFADDMSSVMIKELQKEDNGEYMCQLSNDVSKEKASYEMTVNYGPEPVKVDGEKEVEVNDLVKLTCSAASVPPANFTWKFNGTLTSVKTANYVIEKARYKNSGTYTCEAHNAVTGKSSTHTHSLSVKEEGALDEGLSDGAIAGIVIAVLVALGAAIGLLIYCRQKVPVESPY